jgi:hypothetical protein
MVIGFGLMAALALALRDHVGHGAGGALAAMAAALLLAARWLLLAREAVVAAVRTAHAGVLVYVRLTLPAGRVIFGDPAQAQRSDRA